VAGPLIDAVAAHAARTTVDDLPADAARSARDLLLDALGVGTAGAGEPVSTRLRDVARTWGDADEARVWGVPGRRLPAGNAAFVTGHQMHCLEFDAIHEPAVVHPLTVVVPVLLAVAERDARRGIHHQGADLLAAVAVGVDVAAGLGDVTTTPLQFFRPATAGAVGAAAALGTLTRSPRERIASALGVVYGALSGTMQPHSEGADVLAVQIGLNARAAVTAWDLAGAGFRGPRQVLEGQYGYFRLIEAGGDPEALVARLGRQWEVTRTSVKPFPSGRATHGALDAVLELAAENGLAAADVERVEVAVPPMVHSLVGRVPTAAMTPGEARLCLTFLLAAALRDGRVDLATCSPGSIADPGARHLAAQVTVAPDDNPDPNAFDPQLVRVHLHDGRILERHVPCSLGSPAKPLSREGLEGKFRTAMAAGGRDAAAADAVVDMVARLEDVAATELVELL
jgi:2-methylcitrate dehydratase PrpD